MQDTSQCINWNWKVSKWCPVTATPVSLGLFGHVFSFSRFLFSSFPLFQVTATPVSLLFGHVSSFCYCPTMCLPHFPSLSYHLKILSKSLVVSYRLKIISKSWKWLIRYLILKPIENTFWTTLRHSERDSAGLNTEIFWRRHIISPYEIFWHT